MRNSSRREYSKSNSPVMQSMVEQEDDGEEAEYGDDEIFVGWKLGDKNLYRELEDEAVRTEGGHNTQAIQFALREFQREAGNREDTLSLDQSSAGIELVVGKRGSGKTFFERARSNREAEGGVLNVLVDRKHEYYSNNLYNGIQEDNKNLGKGEEKQTIDTTVLLPYFVKKRINKQEGVSLPGREYTETFKFNFSDLDPNMLSYIFLYDVKENSSRYKDFEKYTRKLRKRMEDGEIQSFNHCKQLAEEMQEREQFNYRQGRGRAGEIKDKLEKYEDWGFLGNDMDLYSNEVMETEELDGIGLEKLVQETNTIAISFGDEMENLPDNLQMPQLYIAILIKKLRDLKKSGKLDKKVKLCIDEAHEFLDEEDPSNQRDAPPAHWQIRQVIKVDRGKGFRVSLATQEIQDLPEKNCLKAVDHAFIPQNIDSDGRRYLLDLYDVHGGSLDTGNKKWQKIFDVFDQYQWLYIDVDQKYWSLLEVASPLAYHKEED